MDSANRSGVVIYSENFYPAIGGAELQLRRLASQLVRRGIPITVVTLQTRNELPRRETLDGITIFRLPYPRRRLLDSIVVPLRLASFLLDHARDFRVLHVQGISLSGALATILARVLGKRTYFAVMGSEDQYIRASTRVPEAILFRFYAHAHGAVALNGQTRHYLIENRIPMGRIRIVPCGVDTAQFKPSARKSHRDANGLTAVYVGRLVPGKGLSYLLQAWAQVVTRYPSATLLLVGDGPLRRELEEQAESLNVQSRVRFLGARQDVHLILQEADLAISPSLSEGLSNSILEAMASGLPVVATRIPGTAELIEDGRTGILVQPADSEDLARGILSLLADADMRRRLGAQAAEVVRSRYSLSQMVDSFCALFGCDSTFP
jgi:glycosyltransferase involved in cell wall biosynthesis